jgi:Predicted membrane protein (DUF2207)
MRVVVFLADEGFTGFHGLSLALLAGAVAAAAAWILVFGWRWMATRPKLPDAGLETREVGTDAPAIVNLLVNCWNVTRSAVQATLLDLASRKYVGIDQYGQEKFVVRIRSVPPEAQMTTYESQVMDLIRERATGGSAPAESITLGEEAEAEAWWQRFRKSVAEDARKQGLARNRWAPLDWAILGSGLAICFGLFALAFGVAHVGGRNSSGENSLDLTDWLGIGLLAWIGAMALLSRLRDLRDTPAGREACARWLGVRKYLREIHAFEDVSAAAVILWERYLAYGVALGVAKDAAHQLPLAPDDPDTAWSRQTGTWREIRVEYPRHFGYGGWPLGVFGGGLARVAFWGGIVFVLLPVAASVSWDVIHDGLSGDTTDTFAIEAAFVGVFVAMALFPLAQLINGIIRVFLGGSDLLRRPQTIEGMVIKIHEGKVAVDDGHSDEVRAWIPPPGATQLSIGSHIRATMSPRLAHVTSVDVLLPAAGAGPRAARAD